MNPFIMRTGVDYVLNHPVNGGAWYIGRTPEACAAFAFAESDFNTVDVLDGAGRTTKVIHRNIGAALPRAWTRKGMDVA